MNRATLRTILSALLLNIAHVQYQGTEHIPLQGGLLVATNHMSWMDTLYLFVNPARLDITALVADKYKKVPVFNWILNIGGVIWLDRDKADFTAFRLAADALRSGVALGIAPEGTRSRNGQLQEGKSGIALLAYKAGVPIVPVGIAGTEDYFHSLLRLRKPRISLTFGPPFLPPPMDRNHRNESLKMLTDEIMCRIAILLPPKYWGYYKDHPRLIEMLANREDYI